MSAAVPQPRRVRSGRRAVWQAQHGGQQGAGVEGHTGEEPDNLAGLMGLLAFPEGRASTGWCSLRGHECTSATRGCQ